MEQRLTFEDGKLTILTDNGKICGNETTTEIEGVFTVSADDVKLIKEMLSDKEFVSILVEKTERSSWLGIGTTKTVLTDSASVEQVYENLVKERNEAELKVLQLRDVIKLIKPLCQWISSRTYRWMVWALFAIFVLELFFCVYGSLCGAHWYDCLADGLYAVGVLVFARALHLNRKNISFVQEVINKVDE